MSEGEKGKLIAGRYEVLHPLGRGGMGKVFLVKDKETGQRLAMKVLRNRWMYNERVIARFTREVEALQQLDHPCISKIYDAQREGDMLFYTMEYVEGKSVREWLHQRGQLNFGSVVRVLCLVAHALDHAHRVTIHRDISPDNIMVLSDGSVRLLDFGLAKLNDAFQGLTMVGSNMGKIQYNAPEQRINAAGVDHRADIYPLGVMFYEMLTGQLPDGKHTIADLRPGLPQGCDAFANKAMAANPEERFATAGEFHAALRELYQQSEMPQEEPVPCHEIPTGKIEKRKLFREWFNPWPWLRRLLRR
ncbi:MAG TPA: serine/threonine-protein kinase [Candidatus Hydrogenedentes bacterium]|nr:serine/threonine-protein kinase [Candidatus Hydrogenedentota bacterium]